jgi:hypothetical protein
LNDHNQQEKIKMSKQVEPKTNTTQSEETKPRYEPPKLILLNKITIGQGVCGTCSTDAQVCLGGNAPGVNGCTSGTTALAGCSVGITVGPV